MLDIKGKAKALTIIDLCVRHIQCEGNQFKSYEGTVLRRLFQVSQGLGGGVEQYNQSYIYLQIGKCCVVWKVSQVYTVKRQRVNSWASVGALCRDLFTTVNKIASDSNEQPEQHQHGG